jgi:hypothetical protein
MRIKCNQQLGLRPPNRFHQQTPDLFGGRISQALILIVQKLHISYAQYPHRIKQLLFTHLRQILNAAKITRLSAFTPRRTKNTDLRARFRVLSHGPGGKKGLIVRMSTDKQKSPHLPIKTPASPQTQNPEDSRRS